jgi:hypothetical protein
LQSEHLNLTFNFFITFASNSHFKNLKRLTAILFLTLILIYSLGYVVIFKLSEFHIKQDMKVLIKKYVPNQKLLCITIDNANAKQLSWHENGKEFSYQGKMYDVVRTETSVGSVAYYCLTDEKETELMASLDKYFNDNTTAGAAQKHSTTPVMKEFAGAVFTLKPALKISCPEFKNRSFYSFMAHISIVHPDNPSPPPKSSLTV